MFIICGHEFHVVLSVESKEEVAIMKTNDFSQVIPELPPVSESLIIGQRPHWNRSTLRHRSCPVCEADSPRPIVIRPDKLAVHECAECRMLYLADVPSNDDIQTYYEDYASSKGISGVFKYKPWLLLRLLARKNPFLAILESTGGVKGQSLCEVGCSGGYFLRLCKHRSARVFGVELDERAVKNLRAARIPTSRQIPSGEQYDIVCLFQLLEHLVNPSEMLAAVAGALRQEGRLLIALPNSGEYQKVGPSWIGFRADLEHLNYFDLHHLATLLKKHNILIEGFWERSQPSFAKWSAPQNGFRLPRKALGRTMNWGRISREGRALASKGTFVLVALGRKYREVA